MRGVLRDGGVLALTSRTWELPQEEGEEVVERGGRRARVTYAWHPGEFEVTVTVDGADPFRAHGLLAVHPRGAQADLLATGFERGASTFSLDAARYLVTSRANSSNASR